MHHVSCILYLHVQIYDAYQQHSIAYIRFCQNQYKYKLPNLNYLYPTQKLWKFPSNDWLILTTFINKNHFLLFLECYFISKLRLNAVNPPFSKALCKWMRLWKEREATWGRPHLSESPRASSSNLIQRAFSFHSHNSTSSSCNSVVSSSNSTKSWKKDYRSVWNYITS